MEERKETISEELNEEVAQVIEAQEEKQLTAPISEEEFRKQIHEAALANHQKVIDDFKHGILHLRDYSGIREFSSIRRAIRRGHVSIYGEVYPNRPFNNRKRGKGTNTYIKRRLYEQLTQKNGRTC